jgi:hypothetical protein
VRHDVVTRVEAAAASLAVLGYGPTTIRTERFG